MSRPVNCIICHLPLDDSPNPVDESLFDCPACGAYRARRSIVEDAPQILDSDRKRSVAGFALRSRQEVEEIDQALLHRLIDADFLPSPLEQADRLILYLGSELESFGSTVELDYKDLSRFGLPTVNDLVQLFQELQNAGLLTGQASNMSCWPGLTLAGWEQYRELQRGALGSSHAFLAMPFNHPDLDEALEACFRPAVADTGFELRRVDDERQAGNIVNRMRVEILTARFVIAELTYSNNGVYWEAGYADGLDKQVVYTCRRDFFERTGEFEEKGGVHFDINQHETVLWLPDQLDRAAEELKLVIRSTLPRDVRMMD